MPINIYTESEGTYSYGDRTEALPMEQIFTSLAKEYLTGQEGQVRAVFLDKAPQEFVLSGNTKTYEVECIFNTILSFTDRIKTVTSYVEESGHEIFSAFTFSGTDIVRFFSIKPKHPNTIFSHSLGPNGQLETVKLFLTGPEGMPVFPFAKNDFPLRM